MTDPDFIRRQLTELSRTLECLHYAILPLVTENSYLRDFSWIQVWVIGYPRNLFLRLTKFESVKPMFWLLFVIEIELQKLVPNKVHVTTAFGVDSTYLLEIDVHNT